MKILAIYLPGFHEDEINNLAWGKGFTEWDNVKNGKKLFVNHEQPLKPLNNYYYDLSKKEDIVKQINIAKKYSIDGFIFYHYWFGNGKKALYKPAELYHSAISDKIEFCFCWANHSWIKNWKLGNSEMIVKQEYGDKRQWIEHINYLIPFFKDDKYIKIDGRPVMYIYNMSDIVCMSDMINVWNEVLINNGLKKIYIVEYISSKNKHAHFGLSDAVVEFEPLYTTFFDISLYNKFKRFICKKYNLIDFQNYDNLWLKNIKRRRVYGNLPIQKGCFSNWDNSARKGHNCMIVKNASSQKFYNNLKSLIYNNRKKATNDYIVINAWNEWSEGAILEPTDNHKYEYLEMIKKVKDEYNEK